MDLKPIVALLVALLVLAWIEVKHLRVENEALNAKITFLKAEIGHSEISFSALDNLQKSQ